MKIESSGDSIDRIGWGELRRCDGSTIRWFEDPQGAMLKEITCPNGHTRTIRASESGNRGKYCLTCTVNRLQDSMDFRLVCMCPRCEAVGDHPWDSIWDPSEDTLANANLVVRAGFTQPNSPDDNGVAKIAYLNGERVAQVTAPSYIIRRCYNCSYTWSQA